MYGFPKHLNTKQDYQNIVDQARAGELSVDDATKALDNLLATRMGFFLKEESLAKPADELSAEDYFLDVDPGSPMERLGFTEEEINELKALLLTTISTEEEPHDDTMEG